jgi:hypothetical protein
MLVITLKLANNSGKRHTFSTFMYLSGWLSRNLFNAITITTILLMEFKHSVFDCVIVR